MYVHIQYIYTHSVTCVLKQVYMCMSPSGAVQVPVSQTVVSVAPPPSSRQEPDWESSDTEMPFLSSLQTGESPAWLPVYCSQTISMCIIVCN